MSKSVNETDDVELEASWSADALFVLPQLASVPEVPGVLLLLRGGTSSTEPYVVWVEGPENLRHRGRELSGYATVGPELSAILMHADLRFRYAVVEDATQRHRIVERFRRRMSMAPPPLDGT